ncbi:ogr/Delta-like zinc finger family protein [Vibrio marinisediminis]|uniref:ogr/Delta-like zinc finger family protein n=1 Tax=Vibrio marinisediminis TaxID=2758441 RepID=UPI0034D26214
MRKRILNRYIKSDDQKTREAYCQCLNLNCGTVFVTYTPVHRIIELNGEEASPELQPELSKDDIVQIEMLNAEIRSV